MIAIHDSNFGFHPRWVAYCQRENIPFKLVNCYANDLINQLQDCEALMWHFSQGSFKDNLIAKQILFALEHTGFQVFPDFSTAWHFDDKVAQKYLFEAIDAPLVPSYVFFSEAEALQWARQTEFPKVFKLRGGAGSQNVRLVNTEAEGVKLIKRAFGRGFAKYDTWGSLSERFRKYRLGLAPFKEVMKGLVRLFYSPQYARWASRERGYIYFQDFIPQNDSDTRIIVIGKKAFALKRYVREGDFRASGSGNFAWARELFDERCVQISFNLNKQLDLQVGAYDFVFDQNNNPLIVEVSYGFVSEVYDPCTGYWDERLNWHEGKTVKEEWMVDLIIKNKNI